VNSEILNSYYNSIRMAILLRSRCKSTFLWCSLFFSGPYNFK